MLTVFLLYRPDPTVHQVLYSDSFRKQVQGKAAFVLDTPEMRRVRETQRIISGVRFWNCLLNICTLRFISTQQFPKKEAGHFRFVKTGLKQEDHQSVPQ